MILHTASCVEIDNHVVFSLDCHVISGDGCMSQP